ncbi:MAG: sulfite exporter TauE/SafE family protein [Polyangiaceae bacterium]|nr:sulfite exporter TauE/SafE family protein [Polyangiaceae bacterium]
MPDTAFSHLLPLLVAFAVSLVTSTAGVSGAFLLLPFQVSVLGYTGPAVTATNHLFNVVAIPSGVYRYVRERRMLWPLAAVISVGALPGVVAGAFVRARWLPDAHSFKAFMGSVLLLLGVRLWLGVLREPPTRLGDPSTSFQVRTLQLDARRLEYEFLGRTYVVASWQLALLAAVVGVIGGAYGVGGGALIAPVLISVAGLPVHSVAGATLFATFLTSLIGVVCFTVAGPLLGQPGFAPNWFLGATLGTGGLLGMYCGARLQRHLPARAVEAVLAVGTTGLAVTYLVRFFSCGG